MKRPPKHAPRRIASTADLRGFQRMMATAVTRPLTAADGMQPRWIDGRPMEEVAAEFVKPNDRLTAFERLQLYGRMYWFRLFDAIRDDCPGLMSALGERAFDRLAQAYLERCPSRSFTLRNLCSRLEGFIRAHPRLTAPRTALAAEIARFEWAQTVAFDGEAREPGPLLGPRRGRSAVRQGAARGEAHVGSCRSWRRGRRRRRGRSRGPSSSGVGPRLRRALMSTRKLRSWPVAAALA